MPARDRAVEYGHKLNLTTGRSGLILDLVIEAGNPADSERLLPMIERHIALYGEPPPFDLLYWNSDSSRLPATMLVTYLRNMYRRNRLLKPGGLTLAGVPIDLGKIKVPSYFLATSEDHIAPWRSCYAGTQALKGTRRFVLGGSGHIAGIVNPPAAGKYAHWTNTKLPRDADAWLAGAEQHTGSWWNDWMGWLSRRSGKKVPARQPGDGKLKPLEDAPGSFVKQRVSD